MWHNNKTVTRTHSKNGSQMAWAIISGISGWKRIKPASADGVTNVFVILSAALANNRKVDVYIKDGFITQATLR
ncbi:MAG: hypothetical protein OEY86_17415 [Nitrospira sp.]|nr:hypothetical protein [Nitrospira sp.]